ncbi:MAG: hypothetical protein ABRQ26_06795 [Syntrophomonadaceae bacterium]
MNTWENMLKALAFLLIICGIGLCLWGFNSLDKEYLLVVTQNSQGSSLVITQPDVGGEHYLLQEPGRVESAALLDEQKVVYQVTKDGKTTTRVFDLKEGNVNQDAPASRLVDYINNKQKRSFEISRNANISGINIKGPVPNGFRAAAVIPDSTYVLGFLGQTLKIFDQDTRALFNTGFEEADCTVNLSLGNKKMAIVGQGQSGSLLLFNLQDMQPIYSEKIAGQVTQADWNESGSALVLVIMDGKTTRCYKYTVSSAALKSGLFESDKPLRVFYLAP